MVDEMGRYTLLDRLVGGFLCPESEYAFRPVLLQEMWYCRANAKMPTVRPSTEIISILDLIQTWETAMNCKLSVAWVLSIGLIPRVHA